MENIELHEDFILKFLFSKLFSPIILSLCFSVLSVSPCLFYYRSLGLNFFCKPLAINCRLNNSKNKIIPGNNTNHHAVKFDFASERSEPSVTVPTGNPAPRKVKADSKTIAAEKVNARWTNNIGSTELITCLRIIVRVFIPIAFAAVMKSSCKVCNATERTTRKIPVHVVHPIITTTNHSDVFAIAVRVRIIISNGNEVIISANVESKVSIGNCTGMKFLNGERTLAEKKYPIKRMTMNKKNENRISEIILKESDDASAISNLLR